MLKLTRNKGESIIVTHKESGAEFTIRLLDVSRNWQVKFGIEAEQTFLIDREEIHERKKAEGRYDNTRTG